MQSSLTQLRNDIVASVRSALAGTLSHAELPHTTKSPEGRHEFQFFIKPELAMATRFEDALDLILERIPAFDLTIGSVKVLSGAYLAQHDIMAAHYGVINRLCRDAAGNLPQAARAEFLKRFGCPVEGARVMGAFEYLAAHPETDTTALQTLWLSRECVKLGGGAYCVRLPEDEGGVYLVNGFHPRQLEHFTAPGRAIVTMALQGELSWKTARNVFLGATDPLRAEEGSLRRVLHERRAALGADAMTGGMIGVHLSAGPLEGLAELRRFSGDAPDHAHTMNNYVFGRALSAHFSAPAIVGLLNNPDVDFEGKRISVFDLTEEADSEEALERLRAVPGL